MFSRRLRAADLINLCRTLRHQLSAGLTLQQILKQQSQRGPFAARPLAGRLSDALLRGSNLSSALQEEKDILPPLFLALVKLGETTGHLAEIFGELEKYFQLEADLRRQFRSQTFMPVIQFVLAILLLAGLIWIMGVIATATNSKPLLTIFGLRGAWGALAFLGVVGGFFGTIGILWQLLNHFSRQKAWMDRLWLSLPVIGPCVRALVMSRFALALQLTLDSGMPITEALRLGLSATGNAHFAAQADDVVAILKSGQTLHEALAASGLFTDDFLDQLASAEISGQVPEMMRHQAAFYHEEAAHKMTTLTKLAGFAVWGCYAVFMIWAIFQLAGIYLSALGGK